MQDNDESVDVLYNIPRIIIQVVSTWRDIKVGIGVRCGHRVHGARLTGLHRANDATATRAPCTLVLGLQHHRVHHQHHHLLGTGIMEITQNLRE